MSKDYSVPVLDGEGDNDYTRYMRTDTLLSLQRRPEDVIHRDELLFQVVHQSTELWLKLACHEVEEAARQIDAGRLDTAARLLGRASLSARLTADQLEMMRHLAPWDFQIIRTVLGHGSGFESPGWKAARQVSQELDKSFRRLVEARGTDLVEVYRSGHDTAEYRLAEAMIDWDERISLWRTQHYKMATRVIGHSVVGTKGAPVEFLAKLIGHKFFPQLWELRTELTLTGPLGDAEASPEFAEGAEKAEDGAEAAPASGAAPDAPLVCPMSGAGAGV
ncbi:tryptophan 2,3-dioxygenase family protein [Streptomyces sp. SP17BM10]|uniref:tryptophan 2,3-dioxygenase family protein n=1 Tax=Streptomyces sp. SP17BM10 TaxID=3002530 RepID=UPI002E7A9C43|nr:tryptophan 2,3-dioxygenase family protein [Streptomyces sp. SP17BM10]MEE1783423.1 tryptophan 2,3-dioxygenase family protein [Streptomyces sp. SP17BM10]